MPATCVQGEMSATVVYYPESYTKLLTLLKERVLKKKPSYNPDNIQIGLSTNFNKLCGCVLQVGPSLCTSSRTPGPGRPSKPRAAARLSRVPRVGFSDVVTNLVAR